MKKKLFQLTGIMGLLFLGILGLDLVRTTSANTPYLTKVVPSIKAQDNPTIYEGCPGTEVALNHPQLFFRDEMGPLGVLIRKRVYVCVDGGWCCSMEWA